MSNSNLAFSRQPHNPFVYYFRLIVVKTFPADIHSLSTHCAMTHAQVMMSFTCVNHPLESSLDSHLSMLELLSLLAAKY